MIIRYDRMMNVDSSAFEMAFFDEKESKLYIKFWGDRTTSYSNFTNEDWLKFSNAISKGSYYNAKIKGNWNHPSETFGGPISFTGRETVEELSTELINSNEPSVNITINIFFNGDPEAIAKAVEKMAPSLKAINNFGRI